uniref:Uncharacterized protein n=1 Tax=Arion vulgaris TaxID=1028688 RepID=A0A0B6ZG78_9EUPU
MKHISGHNTLLSNCNKREMRSHSMKMYVGEYSVGPYFFLYPTAQMSDKFYISSVSFTS